MSLFVMRHGQTDWNLKRIIQGQRDIELNKTGILEANNARAEFNKLNIDLIICSTLKRARETANIINKDKHVKIIYREELIERGLGNLEGMDCTYESDELYNYYVEKNDNGIEPIMTLCNRIDNLINEIKSKYINKNILLVTHGGTARAIERYFYGADNNGILPPENFKNCEIREYKFI